MKMHIAISLALAALVATAPRARTVYRCVRDGTPGLSTAPEAGATCTTHVLDDASPLVPDLLGARGRATACCIARCRMAGRC